MVPDDLLQLSFRWVHVLAAVLWVGLLFGHAWAQRGALEARALFWSRWGAAVAWLSGVGLVMTLYYSGRYPYLASDGVKPAPEQWLPVFGGLLGGYVAYDVLFRLLGRNGPAHAFGVLVWGASAIGYGCWLDTLGVSNRARTVHLGALFATAMAGNAWLRIRPAAERILSARGRGGEAAAQDLRVAEERSRHNVYMAFPVVLLMLSADQPGLSGASPWQATVGGVLIVGFVGCWLVYVGARNV